MIQFEGKVVWNCQLWCFKGFCLHFGSFAETLFWHFIFPRHMHGNFEILGSEHLITHNKTSNIFIGRGHYNSINIPLRQIRCHLRRRQLFKSWCSFKKFKMFKWWWVLFHYLPLAGPLHISELWPHVGLIIAPPQLHIWGFESFKWENLK